MADTNSSENAESEEVTLTNVSRRPLLVRLPGKTMRLGPGDRQTVSKALLATTELLRMCEQRFLVVSSMSETEGEAVPATEEEKPELSAGAPEVSATAESQPATEGMAAESQPTTEAVAAESQPTEGTTAESQPTTEAVAAESQPTTAAAAAPGIESDAAVVQPEVSPESASTSQANSKEKKSTKSKPNLAKPEEN
jgi:hypothetical protein